MLNISVLSAVTGTGALATAFFKQENLVKNDIQKIVYISKSVKKENTILLPPEEFGNINLYQHFY